MSTPFDAAARVYETEDCAATFEHDLMAHFENGYVHSTPEYFIMGRPVNKDAPGYELYDITHTPPREQQNAWLVWLYSGSITHALRQMPYRLPWVVFQRKNELRVYPMDRFESFLQPPANTNMTVTPSEWVTRRNPHATATTAGDLAQLHTAAAAKGADDPSAGDRQNAATADAQ